MNRAAYDIKQSLSILRDNLEKPKQNEDHLECFKIQNKIDILEFKYMILLQMGSTAGDEVEEE